MSRAAAPPPDPEVMKRRSAGRFRVAAAVRYEDLDPHDHVNHARYLAWLEECRLAFRRALEAEASVAASPAEALTPGCAGRAPCSLGRRTAGSAS